MWCEMAPDPPQESSPRRGFPAGANTSRANGWIDRQAGNSGDIPAGKFAHRTVGFPSDSSPWRPSRVGLSLLLRLGLAIARFEARAPIGCGARQYMRSVRCDVWRC
jgi:hypothetical protein